MSSPHTDADEIVVTAGTNTLQIVGDEILQEIVDHNQMVGKKMTELVPIGEKASLFIPVFVRVEGKCRPGALLYTDAHLIVGYTESVLKLATSYARAIPLAAITSSPTSRQKTSAFSSKSPSITVHSPGFSFDAIFNATGTNKPLFSTAVGLLRGFATVVRDGEGDYRGLEIDTNLPSYAKYKNEPDVI